MGLHHGACLLRRDCVWKSIGSGRDSVLRDTNVIFKTVYSAKQTSWSCLFPAAHYAEMELIIILPVVVEFSVT